MDPGEVKDEAAQYWLIEETGYVWVLEPGATQWRLFSTPGGQ